MIRKIPYISHADLFMNRYPFQDINVSLCDIGSIMGELSPFSISLDFENGYSYTNKITFKEKDTQV